MESSLEELNPNNSKAKLEHIRDENDVEDDFNGGYETLDNMLL